VSAVIAQVLPGTPGPRLEAIWEALGPRAREALRKHLLGGTSADWIASTLRESGYPISASTIRTYRRSLEGGV
jgi:hypothetical protein